MTRKTRKASGGKPGALFPAGGSAMSGSAGRRICVFFLLGLPMLALLAVGLYGATGPSSGGPAPQDRYHQAVYLLQKLGGPAAEEPETIPPRAAYVDETESLLHHPDKTLVLKYVAESLADARGVSAKAPLFEAYARLGLGEREQAARLLMGYVVDSGYNAAHYELLCRTLHELGDDTSLLIMGREWKERDPACRGDRSLFLFAALYNLGRFADAARQAREDRPCLGWQAEPYAAKAVLALGDESGAQDLLRNALNAFPARAASIQRLWEQLRAKQRL